MQQPKEKGCSRRKDDGEGLHATAKQNAATAVKKK
jgi:hypothetical protein